MIMSGPGADCSQCYEAEIRRLEKINNNLKREIDILRIYGNKDCTAMADEALEKINKDL